MARPSKREIKVELVLTPQASQKYTQALLKMLENQEKRKQEETLGWLPQKEKE